MPIKKVTAAMAMSREVTASITPEMAEAPAVDAALTLFAQEDWASEVTLVSKLKAKPKKVREVLLKYVVFIFTFNFRNS